MLTEQPLEPELLELMEEGDAEAGDIEHKMKILSAIDETSWGAE